MIRESTGIHYNLRFGGMMRYAGLVITIPGQNYHSLASLNDHSKSEHEIKNQTLRSRQAGVSGNAPAKIWLSSSITLLRTWYDPERASMPDGDSSVGNAFVYGVPSGCGP